MKRKFLPLRDRRVCFSFLVWLSLLAISPCFGSALVNLSLRANVGTGNNVAIGGLIIQGTVGSKVVVVRGLGPSIPIAGRLANPFLTIYNSNGAVIAQNDNWKSTQQTLIAGVGLGPTNDLESAVYLNMAAGNYSAILTGVSQTSGIGLLEMYDLSGGSPLTFVNLSGRANVGVGNNVAITGFVITGSGTRPVVIRGLGKTLVPPLTSTQVLSDPYLTLYNSSGQAIKTNNDWAETQQFQISNSGLAPTYTKEAAIYAALAPGTYSAALSGVANGTGIGIIEVYAVAAQAPPPTPTPTPTPPPAMVLYSNNTEAYYPVWANAPHLLKSSAPVQTANGQFKIYLSAKSVGHSPYEFGRGYLQLRFIDVGSNGLITVNEFRPYNQGNIYVAGVLGFAGAANTPVRVEIWAYSNSPSTDSDFVYNEQFELRTQ